MPLDRNLLNTELSKFSDKTALIFDKHPQDKNDMAIKWSNAIDTFIKPISPIPSTTTTAKAAFKSNMLTHVPPIPDSPYHEPFTMGYRSPENSLYLFISYLNSIGYKSNPLLDKTESLEITNAIRLTYNLAYPTRELTTNDIKYNQSRHNEIYANYIRAGILLPFGDQVITTSGYTRNYENKDLLRRPLLNLQVDGLIGDDTILYKPGVLFNSAQLLNNLVEESYKQQFIQAYNDRVEAQPSDSGDIVFYKYVKGVTDITHTANKELVYYKYIRPGRLKNYFEIPLDKTQSDHGEINWALESGGKSFSNTFDYYRKIFEKNHSVHDPFWIASKIKTIAQLNLIKKLPQKIFNNTPTNKTNALKLLEDSLLIYAQNLALSMLPNFTAAAPPVPVDLTPAVTLGNSGGTSTEVTDLITDLIFAWFKTGIATNNTTGVTTTWI